jgi:BirA family transcriptional regulator, biotin operon repressor / biotin---[acetyl-CoA-carboxylase] ligase
MDSLDAAQIASLIRIPELEVRVVNRCSSTNALLLADVQERTQCAAAHPVLLAAEEQSAGRGQRGRRWRSARGAGATFSILRRMDCAPRLLGGLSLAVGVATARALRALGAGNVALKWPNDLLADGDHAGAKLGGILIETRTQGKQLSAVVGIGINCRPVRTLGKQLRRRVAALDDLIRPAPERNSVIAGVAREVLAALASFEASGLPAFAGDWRALHAHEGRRLRVRLADGSTINGVAAGLAPNGALRLLTRAGTRDVASGRVLSASAP